MLFADLALARRLELEDMLAGAGFTRKLAEMRPDLGAAVEPVAGGAALFVGTGWPISKAVGLGMNGPVTAAEIDQVEEFYRSRGMACRVDLCPLADPTLNRQLGERGYRIAWMLNVLVRPLAPGEAWPAPAAEVSVERIGPADTERWSEVVDRGFSPTDDPGARENRISLVTANRTDVRCYLATVDGEAAGGGAMSIHEGLAGLFSTSTRTAFRRKGVQTALLGARLADAAAAGCDLATVKTSPGSASQRNVERAGFRVVYTRATMIKEWG